MPVSRQSLIDELNELLKDKAILIPDFRRSVSSSGQNLHWLKKHIHLKNPKLHPRIPALLEQL